MPHVPLPLQYIPSSGNEKCRKSKEGESRKKKKASGNKVAMQPGNALPSGNLWERSSEAESRDITLSLFADDTTVVGQRGEIEEGVREMKRVMESFEERNNEEKEERLDSGWEQRREEDKNSGMLDRSRGKM